MTRDEMLDAAVRKYLEAFEPVNRILIARGWLKRMPPFVPAHIKAQFRIIETHINENIDTSDIAEASEEFFKSAKLVKP